MSKYGHTRLEVAGKKPDTGDIEIAEIAVNTEDGLLYSKKSTGEIISVGGSSETPAPSDGNTYGEKDGGYQEVPKTAQENSTGELIKNIVKVTQAEYDALTPVGTTMYLIVG